MCDYARKNYRDLKEDAVPSLHLPDGAAVNAEGSEAGPSVSSISELEPSTSNVYEPPTPKRKVVLTSEPVSVEVASKVDKCLQTEEETM